MRNCAIAELMQMSAAWAVVTKHLPAVHMMVDSEQAKPMLSVMALADVVQFGGEAAAVLDAIADKAYDADIGPLRPGAGAVHPILLSDLDPIR